MVDGESGKVALQYSGSIKATWWEDEILPGLQG